MNDAYEKTLKLILRELTELQHTPVWILPTMRAQWRGQGYMAARMGCSRTAALCHRATQWIDAAYNYRLAEIE